MNALLMELLLGGRQSLRIAIITLFCVTQQGCLCGCNSVRPVPWATMGTAAHGAGLQSPPSSAAETTSPPCRTDGRPCICPKG